MNLSPADLRTGADSNRSKGARIAQVINPVHDVQFVSYGQGNSIIEGYYFPCSITIMHF